MTRDNNVVCQPICFGVNIMVILDPIEILYIIISPQKYFLGKYRLSFCSFLKVLWMYNFFNLLSSDFCRYQKFYFSLVHMHFNVLK